MVGRVYSGRVPMASALVRVQTTRAAPASLRPFEPVTTFTNEGGLFRFVSAPPRYDIFTRVDDRHVVVREGVAARYFEPSVEAPAPRAAWTARVDPIIENPRPGHHLRFFAGGRHAVSLSGDMQTGITVGFSAFSSSLVLTALEIPDGGELADVVAHGRTEVDVTAGAGAAPRFRLEPVTERRTTTFTTKGGGGLVPPTVDVLLELGIFDERPILLRAPVGAPVSLPVIPNVGYVVHARASGGGAELDSGHVFFEIGRDVVEVSLPDSVPILETPEGSSVAAGTLLSAPEPGVVEHLLEPVDPNGTTIVVGTDSGTAQVPDLAALGLPRASGIYRWSVKRYPDFHVIDQLSGAFLTALPSARSRARTLVLH